MLAQDSLYALAAVAMAVANSEAAVDMDADMNMGVEGDTSRTHQNASIAVWTTTQPKMQAPKLAGNSMDTSGENPSVNL